jgi:hypothetical protein
MWPDTDETTEDAHVHIYGLMGYLFASNPVATPESPMSETWPEQPELRVVRATGKRRRAMFEPSAGGWSMLGSLLVE